ncbi:MAG: Ig-like domain-containing protein [Anaerolineae bacterium]
MTRHIVWEQSLDIFKLIVTLILLALFIAVALRRGPSVSVTAPPTFIAPSRGSTLGRDKVTALEGTAEPGATVQLFDGDTLLGETTAGSDGNWHLDLPEALTEGPHSLRAVAVDQAGQELAASEPLALTIRPATMFVVAPSITHPTSGADLGVDEPLMFEGTATPGVTVQLVDDDTLLGETTAGSDGNWRLDLPEALAQGPHSLRAVAVDQAGQELAASEPLALTIRPATMFVVAPSITHPTSGADLGVDEPLMFEGTATPGAKLFLFDRIRPLGEVTAGSDGNWHFDLPAPLAVGEHTLLAVVVDSPGQVLAVSEPLTLTIRPAVKSIAVLAITHPPSGASLSMGQPLVFEGTAIPGAQLFLFEGIMPLGEATAASNGKWRFNLQTPLAEGEHRLRVAMRQTAGGEVTVSSPLIFNIFKATKVISGETGRQP